MRVLTTPTDRLDSVYQLLLMGGQVVRPVVQEVAGLGEMVPLTRTVFVDPFHTPQGEGTIASPFGTIQEAIDFLAGAGGVIRLVPGIYDNGGTPYDVPAGTPLSLVCQGPRAAGSTAVILDQIGSLSDLALVGCDATSQPVVCQNLVLIDSIATQNVSCSTCRAVDSTIANITSTSLATLRDCTVNGTVNLASVEGWNCAFATLTTTGNATLRYCSCNAACVVGGAATVRYCSFGLALSVTGALSADFASVSTILNALSFGSFTAAERANRITITVGVPGVAAGAVGYVNISLVGTDLEGMVPANALLHANPLVDLVAAGAGGGFINVRASAANQARFAFLGPLAGGDRSFILAVL